MKLHVIPVDNALQHEADINLPDDPGYLELREALTPLLGGRPEHVSVLFEGRRADMFVDETSADLTVRLERLPVNEAATAIYHAASLRREPGADTSDWPKIHGPAVVFDQIVWR